MQNDMNTSHATKSDLSEAKKRLDRLIKKARVHLYKPIQIAEILYHDRIHQDLNINDVETYRRISTRWRNEVALRILGRTPQLNSRYEDQLFDKNILPPIYLSALSEANKTKGVVETYIYFRLAERNEELKRVEKSLGEASTEKFSLKTFLEIFENTSILRRSVDKIYEIIVYALFNAITKYLDATITLSASNCSDHILEDFEDFTEKVLGVNKQRREVVLPAKLYRVGATNVNDAGLDMWANYGPCIQVKHVTLSANHIGEISDEVHADQCIIVCKDTESDAIKQVLKQIGWDRRIRGVIVENELIKWYDLSMSAKYASTIGKELLSELHREYVVEFPVNTKLACLLKDRGYSFSALKGIWKA